MLRSLSLLLILSLALYWYATVGIVCPAPLSYQVITPIDDHFGISPDTAREAVATAVTVWERAVGRDLLYETTSNPDITINFVYDERQERALAEESLRTTLENKQFSSSDLQAQFESLATAYQADRIAHEAQVADYNRRLDAFNAQVTRYNDAGGAPDAVFAELEATEQALANEAIIIDREAEELAKRAEEINRIAEAGNQVIRQYNDSVEAYNATFAKTTEFTQGDYRDGVINIYTFTDIVELETVLAHEFGHALSLPHVEGSASIMYYLLGDQPTPLALSETDKQALIATCGETGSLETMVRTLINRYLI